MYCALLDSNVLTCRWDVIPNNLSSLHAGYRINVLSKRSRKAINHQAPLRKVLGTIDLGDADLNAHHLAQLALHMLETVPKRCRI